MKVLVVNDTDGHCTVLSYTSENLRKCLQHLIEIGFDFEDGEEAELLSQNQNATAEQIESFMRDYNAPIDRSGGGQLYIEEIKNDWEFSYGPWD